MKKKKSSAVRSVPPGRAGGRRAQVAQVAGAPSRTQSGASAPTAKPGTRTARAGALDWRYLERQEWDLVALSLNYYLSTIVSTDQRAPIEAIRESLRAQEPTV
jgi:hypothetical protein